MKRYAYQVSVQSLEHIRSLHDNYFHPFNPQYALLTPNYCRTVVILEIEDEADLTYLLIRSGMNLKIANEDSIKTLSPKNIDYYISVLISLLIYV